MPSRYFIRLSYSGTNYNGWQIQLKDKTVQGVLVEKLSVILREPVAITGAGRTDSGVHAKCYYAHFDSASLDFKQIDKAVHQLNSILPSDIAVRAIIRVKPEAHARFSALSGSYEYHLHSKKDPFLKGTSYFYYGAMDIDQMKKACRILTEYNDFKSFSKNHTDVKTYNCQLYGAEWQVFGDQVIFLITADRFLRNMVRAIVGTMLELGKGTITLDDFRDIILSRNRSLAGQSVPPEGLFLTDIKYPENIWL